MGVVSAESMMARSICCSEQVNPNAEHRLWNKVRRQIRILADKGQCVRKFDCSLNPGCCGDSMTFFLVTQRGVTTGRGMRQCEDAGQV